VRPQGWIRRSSAEAEASCRAGSYVIATEPLPDKVVNEINPMDVAVCDVNEVVDYYRLSSDKRLLFGGACNYSGHGVCASHLMGEVVADAVGGTMERFDLFAKMRPYRIPGSQWFGNQLIALGMLYYKMKDLM
jgi:glycine/D-amino acid oxidase-like deaminating enzyme